MKVHALHGAVHRTNDSDPLVNKAHHEVLEIRINNRENRRVSRFAQNPRVTTSTQTGSLRIYVTIPSRVSQAHNLTTAPSANASPNSDTGKHSFVRIQTLLTHLHQEDLHAFQAKHFPSTRKPPGPPRTTSAAKNHASEAEDDLGYYPDGVKRTLTDEQIKIFRHSEIHKLLRARELKREEAEYEARMRGDTEEGVSAKESGEPAHEKRDEQGKEDGTGSNAQSSLGRGSRSKKGNKTGRQTGDMSSEPLDYDDQQERPVKRARTGPQQYSGRRIVSYAEE